MPGRPKYTWQEIQISPFSVGEITAQMEFLHKLLDCDPRGRVIAQEERMAIYDELGRLNGMLPSAFDAEICEQLEAAAKVPAQHTGDRWKGFHENCRMFIPHLWLLFITALISFPMSLLSYDDFPWIFPLDLIMILFAFVWALWATCPLEK